MHEHHTDPNDIRKSQKASTRSRLQKRWIFFGVLALVFVAAYCIVNRDRLASFFSSAEGIGNVLSPLFIGCIIAYLLNPILKFYEYFVFRKLKRKGNLRLGISLLCTFLTAFAILAVLVAMVIPELYKSIKDLVTDYKSYLNGLLALIQTAIDKMELNVDISDMEKLYAFINEVFGDAEDRNGGGEQLLVYLSRGERLSSRGNADQLELAGHVLLRTVGFDGRFTLGTVFIASVFSVRNLGGGAIAVIAAVSVAAAGGFRSDLAIGKHKAYIISDPPDTGACEDEAQRGQKTGEDIALSLGRCLQCLGSVDLFPHRLSGGEGRRLSLRFLRTHSFRQVPLVAQDHRLDVLCRTIGQDDLVFLLDSRIFHQFLFPFSHSKDHLLSWASCTVNANVVTPSRLVAVIFSRCCSRMVRTI